MLVADWDAEPVEASITIPVADPVMEPDAEPVEASIALLVADWVAEPVEATTAPLRFLLHDFHFRPLQQIMLTGNYQFLSGLKT